MPFLWGFIALIGLWLLSGVLAGVWNPLKYVEGFDGRPSTSKFQWCLWTAIVFFSYAAFYATRVSFGYTDPITVIPTNVLYAMGISATTMAAAKGITNSYVASGKLAKASAAAAPATAGVDALVADDTGVPDLSKIQMIGWTVLVGVIYLIRVVQMVDGARDNHLTQLPDIDTALMGLGHGAYLGKKAAS